VFELTIEIKSLLECGDECLTDFVKLVDDVFLRTKSRTGSMLQRYPALFLKENHGNLYTAWSDDKLAGAIAVKKFGLKVESHDLKGAMVGVVCVNPDFRRNGIGSDLVEHVTRKVSSESLDFSVLWTTLPEFYAKHGWGSSDRGLIGELVGRNSKLEKLDALELQDCWESIERIRLQRENLSVSRTMHDYLVVPGSVGKVYAIVDGDLATDQSAYAILGVQETTGIVYEMVGNQQQFQAVWKKIESSFERIFVNDSRDSDSNSWLTENTSLEWKPQNQAMWIGHSEHAPISDLHIPYFDRI